MELEQSATYANILPNQSADVSLILKPTHNTGNTSIEDIDRNVIILTSGPAFDAVHNAILDIYIYPMTILIAFIFIGLIGNGFVLYIFSFRWDRNKTTVFIITLAALDICNCSINMPVEVSVFSTPMTFDFDLFCKLARCFSYINTATYSFVLVAVAYDRYLMICKPLKRMTYGTRYATRTCIGAGVLAVLTQFPSYFLYGTYVFRIPLPSGRNDTEIFVEGRTCLVTNYYYHVNPLPTYIFQGFLFVSHIIIFVTLCVVYVIIGRRLYMASYVDMQENGQRPGLLKKSIVSAITGRGKTPTTRLSNEELQLDEFRTFPKRSPRLHHRSIANDTQPIGDKVVVPAITMSLNDLTCTRSFKNGTNTLRPFLNNNSKNKCLPNQNDTQHKGIHDDINIRNVQKSDNTPQTRSSKQLSYRRSASIDVSLMLSTTVHRSSHASGNDIKELSLKRNTLIMRMVTFTFILSYLPFLVLVTWRYADNDIPGKLSPKGKIAYHVFIKTYFLNSVIRPFIYIIMNEQYRLEVCRIIKRWFRC